VLHEALPILRTTLADGRPLETGIVASYLGLLSRHPDSLIARKVGIECARQVTRWAADVLAAGWPGTERGRRLCDDLDARLRPEGNRLNPGTTADLITTALFAALRDGTVELPRPAGQAGWSGADEV